MVKPDLTVQGADKGKDNKGLAKFSEIIKMPNVQEHFKNLLGERGPQFVSSLLNVVNSDGKLSQIAQTNSSSIIKAASQSAALDLPVDKNLGYSWIIPYGNEAQFQLGWKGFVQLCLRTGIYKVMSVAYVVKLNKWNPLTEELDAEFDEKLDTKEPVGFAFHFSTVNGFSKTAFMTREALVNHGKRFSKAFGHGPWQSDTNAMCAKTLVKMTLSKWGYMSIQMQRALKVDQAVIRNDDLDAPGAVTYDAEETPQETAIPSRNDAIEDAQVVPSDSQTEAHGDAYEPPEEKPHTQPMPPAVSADVNELDKKARAVLTAMEASKSTSELNKINAEAEDTFFMDSQRKNIYNAYTRNFERLSGMKAKG